MKISSKTQQEWEALVSGAVAALEGMSSAAGRQATTFAFGYKPEPVDGARYDITKPVVTPAPDPGRLVVRFQVTNNEGSLRQFNLEAILVFDDDLELIPRETRKVASQNTTTTPFFAAALVPRAPAGAAVGVVNSLAVAALGVGLLAAAVQNKRLSAGDDNDTSLRLHPHYANLLINQVRLAIRVAAEGADLARVQGITANAARLKNHIQSWPAAGGWTGGSFEKTFGTETVRLWRPTVANFRDAQAVVLKFDRVQSGDDDHVLITLMVRPGRTIASIIGDVYLTSNNTIFSIEKTAQKSTEKVIGPWLLDARKRSVEAGLDGLAFVTGVGEILKGLVARIESMPPPPPQPRPRPARKPAPRR
jgi:hypothetical protein